ncbi:mitochondrial 10-formyltetrahydrofolate dehydrogenase [Platysternon megacephalum]|uniref:Mitochondrial 10-formyltetrahydrofolate dehydrogenase n=1 Tax=Platysternon megacephalum TaxID=55544 RepID=A0A4D9EDW4_9SAUR|nr:mitochondrial 10-formyltetrahydrofolate dehydrogenase [Platysternon megacephalum]
MDWRLSTVQHLKGDVLSTAGIKPRISMQEPHLSCNTALLAQTHKADSQKSTALPQEGAKEPRCCNYTHEEFFPSVKTHTCAMHFKKLQEEEENCPLRNIVRSSALTVIYCVALGHFFLVQRH